MRLSENLPSQIDIISLPEVLVLPKMVCNLKIFDGHTSASILNSFSNKRVVGLIQPKYARFSNNRKLERVGVACKVMSFQELSIHDDVYYELTLQGLSRFTVNEFVLQGNNLMKADVDWSKFELDLDYVRPSRFNRRNLIAGLNRYLLFQGQKISDTVFDDISDQMLIDSIAMSLHFTPEQRQALLECVDYNDRCAVLMEIFYMDHPVPHGFDEGLDFQF